MACTRCGRNLESYQLVDGLCLVCRLPDRKPDPDPMEPIRVRAAKLILTTETASATLIVTERLGIVTAECVFGMHFFKDLFAAGRDFFGGRSSTVQNTLKEARNTVLSELRIEAARLGADAVLAINLNYSEIAGGGKSMLFLVATGTAVRLGKPSSVSIAEPVPRPE